MLETSSSNWRRASGFPRVIPLSALAHFSHFYYSLGTLFAGRLVPAFDVPWAYLPTHILLALPELVLVLLLCAPISSGSDFGAVASTSGVKTPWCAFWSAAGFRLVEEGTFLRNPNDPRDKNTPDPPQPKDEFVLKFVRP